MSKDIHSHTAWCIVRFANGRFERVKEGYKSAENARRSIPSVVKADRAEGVTGYATYAVGHYTVGNVVIHDKFRRYCA